MGPSVIDLFSGAGGLTAALESVGWDTVAAVDSDADCVATLQANKERRIRVAGIGGKSYLGRATLIRSDIREVNATDLRPPKTSSRWRPDLLAGGPPCQPFSSAGLMRGISDPRGQLFREFVRLTAELRPRFVLFENVAGLVTAKSPDGKPGGVLHRVQRAFEKVGYACRFELLNAADFGAAQRRVRLYMIASSGEALPEFPHATHTQGSGSLIGWAKNAHPWTSLSQFLPMLPSPHDEDIVRPTGSRARELARLSPGTGLRAKGIVEANRPGGHWGYRQDCFVADLTVPARTIRAASTPDFIRLSDGSLRRLTWRECAALQGFPADWLFVGTRASRFRQIGNAVQGNVGQAIGAMLFRAASERSLAQPTSAPWPPAFHRRVRYTAMEHIVNGAHRAAARELRQVEA
jgi:DNA (cytosine-5)-methyltransferase 1